MKILAVDDEIIALKILELKLHQCEHMIELYTFTSPSAALNWAQEHSFDLAFLDINMRGIDGLTLAANLKTLHPHCMIVFVTGYTEYAIDAFKIKANGYLVKPIDIDDLKSELDFAASNTNYQSEQTHNQTLYVQCFGNFEVFANGKPLIFHRQKSKEIFAYLIDRKGATITLAELASILWEDGRCDRSRTNQIHTFIHDLVKTLKEAGEDNIILKSRNAISIDINKFDCDYYDCIKGNPAAINAYTGEYMSQYSWAELTGGKMASQFSH